MTVGVTRNMRTSSGVGIGSGRETWSGYFSVKHAQEPSPLLPIGHGLRVRRHRQSRDSHQSGGVVIDRQRHAIISRQIFRLLAVATAQEVKREAFVRVAHRGCLRPTVRP